MNIVAIFAIFAAVVLPILVVFQIVRMLIQRRDSQSLSREERAQLQRLADSLQRMEERIGNLETILMDKNRPADPGSAR